MFLINPYILQNSALDADAQAFITAASITDTTEKSAINQLVLDLKSASIWSKMYQFMPFCFNDATKNQYDLMLNQNVVFSGGITHASGYIQGNGTNGYVDTQINPSVSLLLDSSGVSYFSNNDTQENIYHGVIAGGNYFATYPRNTTNNFRGIINSAATASGWQGSNTNSLGYFTFNRTSSSVLGTYKDGSLLPQGTDPSSALPNGNLYFLRANGLTSYSARQYNCYALHQGLDATESLALYNAVTTFKTTLGI